MKRIAFWALPLLFTGTVATHGFAQESQPAQAQAAPARAEEPKWKDTKEYEDYMVVWSEKADLAKKAASAEKFLVDHKDADPIALTDVYRMLFLSYANAGNWAKVLETFDRMGVAPKLTDQEKFQYTQVGMAAAINTKNTPKTIEFAEKVLKLDPKNVSALVTLSGALSATMPTANPGKDSHIVRTLDVTKQALALPRPAQGYNDAQWTQVQQQLHDTACLMLLNQQKYAEAIAECQAALKVNPKDAYAWYWIGLAHRAAFVELNKKYNDSVKEYNEKRLTAPQLQLDDLRAAMQGAEKVASDKLDETLDALARAAAIGGDAGTQAHAEMKKLFTGTPEDLQKLIDNKK